MADYANITVKEGETMAEAIMRTAKEQTSGSNNSTGLRAIKKVPKTEKQVATKRTASRSKSPVTDPSAGSKVDGEVYSAIHVYKRDGDTDGKVRWNANHEREFHGPNTLVFMHPHAFGGTCSSACKERVIEED